MPSPQVRLGSFLCVYGHSFGLIPASSGYCWSLNVSFQLAGCLNGETVGGTIFEMWLGSL